jgi:hypothetical protein
MLKVYIYAYSQKIFSSRRIAKALRESIPFMWLSGNNHPDFRTINNFRGQILKGMIQEIFIEVLLLLVEGQYIKLEDYFVDGTKVEANANRYSYVWGKNTNRYQKQIAEKVAILFKEIDRINEAENARYGDKDLEDLGEDNRIPAEKLTQRVEEINERLRSEAEDVKKQGDENPPEGTPPQKGGGQPKLSEMIEEKVKEVKQALEVNPKNKSMAQAGRILEKEYLPRAKKYEDQQEKLAGRNSYSKTDSDATFMRMKEDHLGTGQLRPAYNIQIGTEKQFVVGFSIHQKAGDTSCLIPHLEQVKEYLHRLPEKINSDAGYGSEENYAYLEQEKVGNYLKYNTFDRERKKNYKPDPFSAENMAYDVEKDEFSCPNGKSLKYQKTIQTITENGYSTPRRVYECEDCTGCLLKEKCTKAVRNRQSRVSFKLWEYRRQAKGNLCSEEGLRLRSQRGVDVESVFGRIKGCWEYRRFLLRGLEKVGVEVGLLSMAQNLAKVWSVDYDKRLAAI